ncbi:MAG TPA: efflux RND transporter periplasmic adaptor subunit [Candidatus Polarisedimenticolia bacterium]|jgi:RND family efflux transporter MFP subunit
MSAADLSALRIHRDDEPDRPRPGRKALIWIAALIAVGAAGWFAWRSDWLPSSPPEVRVSRPRLLQAGGVDEVLTATGYIVPQRRATISARTSGRLDWLGVDEGSRVKAGDVIARLSNDDLAAQVAEARASLAESRARLEQSRSTLWEAGREVERQRNLMSQGITTESSYDAAKRSHDVAVSGVAASEQAVKVAEARVSITEANFDKTIIRAPFDGVVTGKSSEIGEMVAAGAFSGQPTGGAIVTLADFSTLEMEADVNESNLSRVSVGQPALVTVDAVPGRKYRGSVRQLVPAVDRQKAVVQAKIRFLDADDHLLPDMSARVSFLAREVSAETAAAPPRIYIPASSVRLDGGDVFVLVVKDERVVRVPVRLGESHGDLREVVSGLNGEESLIEGSATGLREGDRVRVAS